MGEYMRVAAAAALVLTSAMLTPSPAAAENPYINIPEQGSSRWFRCYRM
jgi:hypothetical protein